jgi:manganese/zinc/iron transport system ATP- binding protein
MTDPRLPYSGGHHHDPRPGAPALITERLSVAYAGSKRLALREVSLCVPIGARVALVGANGAGKSTLLKAVAKLLPIQSGSIRIYGNAPGACHHRVAYLPQRGEIDWRFPVTLRRLVMTGRYVHLGWLNRPTAHDWTTVDAVIDQLRLSDLAQRQIGQLSGGQQQRALLARALAQEADLLLLDEPLNAVDADTRAIISAVLGDLRAQGKTVIAATHDLGRLEADFDSAVYLADGREIAAPPGAFIGVKVSA